MMYATRNQLRNISDAIRKCISINVIDFARNNELIGKLV